MRAAALLSMVAWVTASAQTRLPPEQLADLLVPKSLGVLKCQAEPLRPVLDFSLRFRAGYTVRVPLNQYRGSGHKWTVVVQIQPDLGGPPVYFLDRLNLPNIPDAKAEGDAGGGYLLGTGRYHASLVLLDDQARVCRAEWNIEAQLGLGDRDVRMAIQPGNVQDMSLRAARSVNSQGRAALGRLTVLLHAAPVSPRMSKVQARDAVTLLGALSSLLDLAPARSVRLVVFNLDQQKEIYRQEHFTPDQLETVRQAVFDLQLASVDYHTLQNPTGHLDLLEHLVDEEVHAENRSDAVVFLGPHARSTDKRAFDIGKGHTGWPKFFYVEYQPWWMMARPTGPNRDDSGVWGTNMRTDHSIDGNGDGHTVIPDSGLIDSIYGPSQAGVSRDSIDYLVSILKGKTLVVRTPVDFAKAMNQIAPQKGQ